MTITAKGQSGTLAFDGTFVTISRTGLARMTVGKGDKRIPIASVSGVDWKPAGMLVNGYIQITMPGGIERRSRAGSRTFDAAKDENSVVFTKGQQAQFEQVRQAIEQAIAQRMAPQPVVVQPAQASVADELAKLGALVQQGLLTQQEYEAQKARLLSR